MDPLSLTASIIAIVGVGGEVTKAVRKLASLKGAPDLILALNNEISDLYLVILAIRDIFLRQRANIPLSLNNEDTVIGTLTQANDKVLELRALHLRLSARTTTTGPGDIGILNKASWLREQRNVKKMQEDLRTVRLKLSATLGILNSSSLLQLETGIQALHTKLEDVQVHQRQSQQVQDINLAKAESAVEEPIAQLLLGQQRIELKLNADSALEIARAAKSQISGTTQSRNHGSILPPAVCVTAFTFNNRCIDGCMCRCHHLQAWRSPRALNNLLGRLFCGYAGLPYLGPSCDSRLCDRDTYPIISIVYFFPVWLLARAFAMIARLPFNRGPEINIRFPQIVPNTSKLFNLASHGKIDEMQSLFRQGLASPFDMDALTGCTALMWAIEGGHVEACKTLPYAGADPYHEDTWLHNGYYYVGMLVLCKRVDRETSEQLQTLFPDQGFLEGLQLSLLHRTVLGLNNLDLASLASSLPESAINDVDSDGKTPLFWAAYRGESTKVSLLIGKGADINKCASAGSTPAFAAIASRDEASMKKILSLVSNVNCRNSKGWTLLLLCCYYGISKDVLELLISRGADIESSVCGDTALIIAAQENHRYCGELLISHGTKLNTIGDDGETALLRAINLNSHQMIQLLLHHHADYYIKTPCGETTLHYAAQYSDLKSLEILSAANLSGLEIQGLTKGYTALQMAETRKNMRPEWLPKLHELVESVVLQSNQNLHGDTTASAAAPSDTDEFVDAVELQD